MGCPALQSDHFPYIFIFLFFHAIIIMSLIWKPACIHIQLSIIDNKLVSKNHHPHNSVSSTQPAHQYGSSTHFSATTGWLWPAATAQVALSWGTSLPLWTNSFSGSSEHLEIMRCVCVRTGELVALGNIIRMGVGSRGRGGRQIWAGVRVLDGREGGSPVH